MQVSGTDVEQLAIVDTPLLNNVRSKGKKFSNVSTAALLVFSVGLLLNLLSNSGAFYTGSVLEIPCTVLQNGFWFNDRWNAAGCQMAQYNQVNARQCLRDRNVTIIGDSQGRHFYLAFASLFEQSPVIKHHQSSQFTTADGSVKVLFIWDPFLNSTESFQSISSNSITVINYGAWYMRYSDSFARAKSQYQSSLNRLSTVDNSVHVSPILPVVSELLSQERRQTLTNDRIAILNSILKQKAQQHKQLHVNNVFYEISLKSDFKSADGLHYESALYETQRDLLLNRICNEKLHLSGRCCTRYQNNIPHSLVFGMILIVSLCLLSVKSVSVSRKIPIPLWAVKILQLIGVVCLAYICDRLNLISKQDKFYNQKLFVSLICIIVVGGLSTIKRNDSSADGGFMNRQITQEWKGWMQLVILAYHYAGASSVIGIYNFMRILVASYLYLSAYGHFMQLYTKADFSWQKLVKTVLRLNLLTIFLSYITGLPYQKYYFTPLITFWYIVLYVSMLLLSKYNQNVTFLLSKLLVIQGLLNASVLYCPQFITWPMKWISQIAGIQWDNEEWLFRLSLDVNACFFGALTALLVQKCKDYNCKVWQTLQNRQYFMQRIWTALGLALIVWYINFQLSFIDKPSYNQWHPYISVIPILGYIMLRNCNSTACQYTSGWFEHIGGISLETFVLQYHVWLANDSKGLLTLIPVSGAVTFWFNLIATSLVFWYTSKLAARCTNDLVASFSKTLQRKQNFKIVVKYVSVSLIVMLLLNHLIYVKR
ncbi:hypothetical protein MP228_012396 [Amoeboaphelidium protococcarum]|nr:hypothetical protein MP228_012396 [Amoeboaphelidium protococcarum]